MVKGVLQEWKEGQMRNTDSTWWVFICTVTIDSLQSSSPDILFLFQCSDDSSIFLIVYVVIFLIFCSFFNV